MLSAGDLLEMNSTVRHRNGMCAPPPSEIVRRCNFMRDRRGILAGVLRRATVTPFARHCGVADDTAANEARCCIPDEAQARAPGNNIGGK